MEQVFLVTAVVGAVEFLKRLQKKDYWAGLTILVAGAIGAVAGALSAPGVLDVWTGIVIGLGASGLITTVTRIGLVKK